MSFNTKLATAVLTGLISSAFIAAVPANAAGNMPAAEKTQQAEKEKHACKRCQKLCAIA